MRKGLFAKKKKKKQDKKKKKALEKTGKRRLEIFMHGSDGGAEAPKAPPWIRH